MISDFKLFSIILSIFFLASCSDNTDQSLNTAAETSSFPSSVEDASTAMGLDGVNAISLEGNAWRIRNSFRQTLTASPPWPERDEINNWVQTIDFSTPAMLGSGDTFASNLFLLPPVAGVHRLEVPADSDSWRQQMEIWLTPWGFIKGAQRFGAETEVVEMNGSTFLKISWQSPGSMVAPSGLSYSVEGYVNNEGLVTRTETRVEDAFMGDMHVVGVFSDYQDFGGLMVPTMMEQQRGGGGVFGVSVSTVSANSVNLDELINIPESSAPDIGGGNSEDTPVDLTEQVGEGAWLVKGGYVALVVEFDDHLAVFEAGQSETRGEQIIQQIRDYISDKEIRYVINSHPHSDHTAGLVPFMREGATLVTHEANVEFLDMALNTPRTLLGEEPLNAQVMGITGTGVLEDDTNRIELHPVPNLHTEGMLVAVLPDHGLLFQADFTLPQPGSEANPFVKTLARYVEENDIQFDRYLAVHAASVNQTRDDLLAAIAEE